MSRFSPARTAAITVWTGAIVAWSTALVAGFSQPPGRADGPPTAEVPRASIEGESRAAVPAMPGSGLVILRSSPEPSSETVHLAAQEPTPQPRQITIPQPVSSGS